MGITMRSAKISRKTSETDIRLTVNLDGTGKSKINTGCGFLDHMLTLFSKHGRFDMEIDCIGDTNVDYHHTTEDIGIVLGEAFLKCLGNMSGIRRYADVFLPMDEALVLAAVDVSGRAHLEYSLDISAEKIGDFDTELIREFFEAFVRTSRMTLHIRKISGVNSHHIAEAAFKGAARAVSEAVSVDERYKNEIPSTKGTLL